VLTVLAPAKVNLVLEVLERREAYHIISSVAQTIDLCDTLTLEPANDVSFTCSEPGLLEGNLVVRAAGLLRERFRIRAGACIHLEKRIPWGAGLGGGSSDAAAALQALNRMWAIGAPPELLDALGSEIGSDVPLFLRGGTVFVEGRGELVRPLPDHPVLHAVLSVPDSPPPAGKTGLMYRRLEPALFTRGQFVRAATFALERGRRVPDELMFNVFEKVADEVFPDMARNRAELGEAAGAPVHLAGSGPCLYSVLESATAAASVARKLSGRSNRVFTARFLGPAEPNARPS
jgi:4-diphosphocytidyl-2-C-methyl-D-erythritol kinase